MAWSPHIWRSFFLYFVIQKLCFPINFFIPIRQIFHTYIWHRAVYYDIQTRINSNIDATHRNGTHRKQFLIILYLLGAYRWIEFWFSMKSTCVSLCCHFPIDLESTNLVFQIGRRTVNFTLITIGWVMFIGRFFCTIVFVYRYNLKLVITQKE